MRSGLCLRRLFLRLEWEELLLGSGERPLDCWRPPAMGCAEEGDELLEEPEGEDIAWGEGRGKEPPGAEGYLDPRRLARIRLPCCACRGEAPTELWSPEYGCKQGGGSRVAYGLWQLALLAEFGLPQGGRGR